MSIKDTAHAVALHPETDAEWAGSDDYDDDDVRVQSVSERWPRPRRESRTDKVREAPCGNDSLLEPQRRIGIPVPCPIPRLPFPGRVQEAHKHDAGIVEWCRWGLQMTSDCRAQVRQAAQIWIRMSGLAGWVRMKSARTLIGARMTSWRSRTWSLRRTLKAFACRGDDVG